MPSMPSVPLRRPSFKLLRQTSISSSSSNTTSTESSGSGLTKIPTQDVVLPVRKARVAGLKRFGSRFRRSNKDKGKQKEQELVVQELGGDVGNVGYVGLAASEASSSTIHSDHLAIVQEETIQASFTAQNADTAEVSNSTSNGEPMPSDSTLTHRFQSLFASLPPACLPSFLPMKTPSPLFEDSKLQSLLSSTTILNESLAKGRDSVVAMLERLSSGSKPPNKGKEKETDTMIVESHPLSSSEIESTSVMISSPLQPTSDTEVEIARSEIVSVDLNRDELAGNQEETGETSTSQSANENEAGGTWSFMFGKEKKSRIKEIRVWYPSRTDVSLKASWWGYQIYLPPPVMRILSDKSLEAAKRAAMITAALTWLVSNIPVGMLPLQVRPVVGVAKEIVPLFGYVGAFIAWSWNTVRGFDKGDGVILSAPWILPIAIVPGTWFYEPPPPHETTPPSPPPKDVPSTSTTPSPSI